MLDKVGIDYMIVSNKYHYKEDDNICIYKIEKESIDSNNFNYLSGSKYWITEEVGGWRSTMEDLIISYKRDKKIDDIFGENI